MKKVFFFGILFCLTLPIFAQNSAVVVITPNGGENWQIGCPNTIQWITATPVTVKIELFKNGVFYMTIASQVPSTQSSYSWTPPYTVSHGNTFKVKITCLTSSSGFDFSNANFSINLGTITVTSPNGGEVWLYGTTHLITWNDNVCENVRIELWKSGSFFSLLTASTLSNGSFPWAITNSIPSGSDYKIKILSCAINSSSATLVYDFSDAFFTIGTSNSCYINVVSPNGGEGWAKGTTHNITWQDNTPYQVRIELWKGGVYNSLITSSTPSTGSFPWAIPMTIAAGTDYKIKIIALITATSTSCYDFSENNFLIIGSNTGNFKFSEIGFNLYPNPCSEVLNVKIPGSITLPFTFKIMNVTGTTVFEEIVQDNSQNEDFKINTTTIADGFYIFLVKQDQEIVYKKTVIIRH